MPKTDPDAKRAYRATLLRLNARAWGIAVGAVFGLILFVATLLLIIEGGPDVGLHLALLGKLLPGYRVTVGGAFIGFGYMFVIGYAIGRVIGIVYNFLARGD
jgi:tetrahydromethanopterin S-methyltransferase subunit G